MQPDERKDEIVLATFQLDDIHLALSTQHVREALIIEKQIVPCPSGEDYIEGIMDLRGRIIPVINLKKRLHLSHTTYEDDRRAAVVVLRNMTIGILFDSVRDVIRIPAARIENLNGAFQGTDPIVTGVLNHTETGRIIEIIDPLRLLPAKALDELDHANLKDVDDTKRDKTPGTTTRLVVLMRDGREYAVGIDSVRGVETIEAVDRTFESEFIEGAVTIHERTLPLVRLATSNRRKAVTSDTHQGAKTVVILCVHDALCAVMIDRTCEMITVKESEILQIPEGSDGAAPAVVEPSEGRSILILDPSAMLRPHLRDIEAMNRILKRDSIEDFKKQEDNNSRSVDDSTRNYLFFEVDELFAISLQHVQEILPPMAVIALPTPRNHMDGILNLRKTLMPQFNMRSFLGFSTQDVDAPDKRKVIVLNLKEHTIALSVDNILSFATGARETHVPPLGGRLDTIRQIFKSLIVPGNGTRERRHALRIDPEALVHELILRDKLN